MLNLKPHLATALVEVVGCLTKIMKVKLEYFRTQCYVVSLKQSQTMAELVLTQRLEFVYKGLRKFEELSKTQISRTSFDRIIFLDIQSLLL